MSDKIIDISLVGMCTYKAPTGMEGWNYYRIEYGGSNVDCIHEEGIWLPPNLDEEEFENLLIKAQEK